MSIALPHPNNVKRIRGFNFDKLGADPNEFVKTMIPVFQKGKVIGYRQTTYFRDKETGKWGEISPGSSKNPLEEWDDFETPESEEKQNEPNW